MKIVFDSERCTGHAQCFAAGPDAYDLDDAGYCVVLVDHVPDELHHQAVDGAAACPEQALRIVPD